MKNLEAMKSEIRSIEEKIKSTDQQIEQMQKEISGSGWQDDEIRNSLRTLQDDRQMLENVLREKRESLSELEDKAERNRKLERIKELAEEAEKKYEASYVKLLHQIDQFLASKIPELVKIQGQWEKKSFEFNRLADSIAPGFTLGSSRHLSISGRGDELTSRQFIEELEADGVNLDAVLSGTAIGRYYYTHVRRPVNTDGLHFSEAIEKMKQQRNIPELMELEPETE